MRPRLTLERGRPLAEALHVAQLDLLIGRLETARRFFAASNAAEYLARWKTPEEWLGSVY
jgi:hypothetical protein